MISAYESESRIVLNIPLRPPKGYEEYIYCTHDLQIHSQNPPKGANRPKYGWTYIGPDRGNVRIIFRKPGFFKGRSWLEFTASWKAVHPEYKSKAGGTCSEPVGDVNW